MTLIFAANFGLGRNSCDQGLSHLSVYRRLRRVADLAADIAEDVIYMKKGEIIRHRTEDFKSH